MPKSCRVLLHEALPSCKAKNCCLLRHEILPIFYNEALLYLLHEILLIACIRLLILTYLLIPTCVCQLFAQSHDMDMSSLTQTGCYKSFMLYVHVFLAMSHRPSVLYSQSFLYLNRNQLLRIGSKVSSSIKRSILTNH